MTPSQNSPASPAATDRFNNYHVVLVEPAESLNIGSVARAMRNLGFSHLHLVAPVGYDRERAQITACWAEPILDTLQIHSTLPDALGEREEVVGLSLRNIGNPSHFVSLPAWIDALPAGNTRQTALVFGPEASGLRREHISLCRWLVHIPATIEQPSFNLAQSVLLVLYSLSQKAAGEIALLPPPAYDLPTGNDYQQLDRLLDAVMTESGFLRPGTPEPLPDHLHHLFRQMPLDRQEMGILLGLFGRVNTELRYRGKGGGGGSPPA